MRHRARHPESPLIRFLRDPGGTLAHALHACVHLLEQALPFIAATSAAGLAFVVTLAELRRRRAERLATGARLVRVAVPPATAREQRRLLAVARRLKAGQLARPLARLLDLVDPTPAPPSRPAADPALAAEVREVLAKAAQPVFRVAVRLAVAAP